MPGMDGCGEDRSVTGDDKVIRWDVLSVVQWLSSQQHDSGLDAWESAMVRSASS